ncbi:unnamed protein product [Clavelina lepadiformis]|uniref:Sulfotransferase n=1 Tax=Clavelina lepadiformis TaxID=159417 RepID=A0ABP0FP14_CLALP
MAADKKVLMAMFMKMQEDVLKFIPENERPDVTDLVGFGSQQFLNPKVTECKGYRFPPPFSAETVEWQYDNWTPTDKDVLVASYPKTGTTWTTQIVKSVIYKDDENMMALMKVITPNISYLESGTPKNYDIMLKLPWKRKIWGTHLPAPLINMERLKKNRCKIIYVMRNPKDQVVSWFNMNKNMPFNKTEEMAKHFPAEWNAFFETLVNGKQPVHSKEGEWYPDHILSWYPYRNDDNVLFLMYEEMKKDPAKEIKKIADFLGVKRSDEEIGELVEATSFQSMKKEASKPMSQMSFFRKGKVADWKNQLTVAQSELMDEKFNEKLSGIDIKFTYE